MAGVWDGLALAVAPGRVLLDERAVGLLLSLIERVEQASRRDGISLSPALRDIRAVLSAAKQADSSRGHLVHAHCGHGDVPNSPDGAGSDHGRGTSIGTAEAAEILGLSPRQSRRLATEGRLGPVYRIRGAIKLDRAEVLAAAAGPAERSTA